MNIDLGSWTINMIYNIFSTVFSWWNTIVDAVGLTKFWVGTVVLVLFFSIVLTPMRGGQLLGGGAIGAFTQNKIHNARNRKANKTDGDD